MSSAGLAVRPRRSTARTSPLVSSPVALALDVLARILAEVGRADDEDLEALWPGRVASPRAGRDAHRVVIGLSAEQAQELLSRRRRTERASRCGPGRSTILCRCGRRSRPSPAKGILVSDGTPAVLRTIILRSPSTTKAGSTSSKGREAIEREFAKAPDNICRRIRWAAHRRRVRTRGLSLRRSHKRIRVSGDETIPGCRTGDQPRRAQAVTSGFPWSPLGVGVTGRVSRAAGSAREIARVPATAPAAAARHRS
jgi:hypothetical protein